MKDKKCYMFTLERTEGTENIKVYSREVTGIHRKISRDIP